MALELLAVTRRPVVYFDGNVNAGADVPTALGGAAGTYLINRAAGNARLLGCVESAQAPAAGFPRIRFFKSPSASTALFSFTAGSGYVTADPNNANTFLIDCPLFTPFFTIEYTQGATGGNVTIIAWVLPEGGGSSSGSSGGSKPVNPSSLPATYRLTFSGLVFASVGGQFAELRNPAGSGKVIRVTIQQFSKPSVTVHWQVQKQSSLSTGGTASTPTPVPLDSTDAAASGVVKLYTAAPTAGASVGNVYDVSANAADFFEDDPGGRSQYATKPVTLRPGESVGWLSDVAGTMAGMFEWTEAVA